METYRHCRPGLRVRFLALHLCLVLLFAILFSVSASGTDGDRNDLEYYLNTDSTLIDVLQNSSFFTDYRVFGRTWGFDPNTNRVTKISGLSTAEWNKLDEGDRILLVPVLDALLGAQSSITALEDQVITQTDLNNWTNELYTASVISSGANLTKITVPNLLALLSQNQSSAYKRLDFLLQPTYNTPDLSTGSDSRLASVSDVVNRVAWNQKAQFDRLNTLLTNNNVALWSSTDGSKGGGYAIADILAMMSANQRNQYTSFVSRSQNSGYDVWRLWDGSALNQGRNRSLADIAAIGASNIIGLDYDLKRWLTFDGSIGSVLYKNGGYQDINDATLPWITTWGFQGLASMISNATSTQPGKIKTSAWNPNDPLSELSNQEFTNLFDYLGWMFTQFDRSLTKLQYVLANDEDIRMKQQEQENQETVRDEFFGDGEGAVKPTDISDAAGVAGDIKQTFDGAGSVSDAFTPVNDATNYSFFSQEVADELDKVGQPASQMDENYLDMFQVDEDGFYSLKPSSLFDVSKYLEELGK